MFEIVIHWLLIAYLIIAPSVVALRYRDAKLALALVLAGAAALVFTRLPDISSFELLGLKTTLERQIGKVEVTLTELKKLATAAAKANLTELAMSGQIMSRLNTETKFTIRNEIVNSLR